ncbi:TMEM165/GDT1 family protein [Saccharomonospora sp. NPDC046836]|uniref:TMEM165/GDT1 family protein n=1 Tax=Saccharomonospora sp. NPDC046836 TaxID=3156921 RepID=UPI0033CE3A1A
MELLTAFAVSTGAIFVAEMGDKTQLVALSLATRYRALTVMAGITAATVAVHGVSVLIAEVLGLAIPTDWITLIAGVAFLFFGAWTLRGDTLTDQDEQRAGARRNRSAFMTVATIFFLAELGDKTMLATITVGTNYANAQLGWLAVWVGSTLGMVLADGIAVLLGRLLGKRLPERAIQIGAALLFFAVGAVMTVQGIVQLTA